MKQRQMILIPSGKVERLNKSLVMADLDIIFVY